LDIVFVRHGKTRANEEGRFSGVYDSKISLEGREGIKKLRTHLDGIGFDGIYVSPLGRTIETANLLTVEYKTDERIKEMNFGIFEGLTYNEILERYPEPEAKWSKDFLNYRIPDGESMGDVFERTRDFINEISQRHERVLVITHGGIIRCALSMVFGAPDHFYRFKIQHGMANVISIDDDYMYIKGINCREGLREVLL
jgi:alpha-ribazole phosphatase